MFADAFFLGTTTNARHASVARVFGVSGCAV
jgi:hypothetical protein